MEILLFVLVVYCIIVTIALKVIFEKLQLLIFQIRQNKDDLKELRKIVLNFSKKDHRRTL